MGIEIVDQVPDLDAVIVPVGGGGCLPASRSPSKRSGRRRRLSRSKLITWPASQPLCRPASRREFHTQPTLADGLAIPQVGTNAFNVAKDLVDRCVLVSEEQIALSILRIVEVEKTVVEGSAATPLAACLSGQLPELAGKKVVLLLCGGNIDPNVLSRVVERGLVSDGRLARFTAVISDRPGGLADLTSQIAAAGASIKQVVHDRAFAGSDVSAVHVFCTVETRDHQHLARAPRTPERARRANVRFEVTDRGSRAEIALAAAEPLLLLRGMRKRFARAVSLTFVTAFLTAAAADGGTLVVTNTNNNLAGSLRQAIQDAAPGDTIVFQIPTTDTWYDSTTGGHTVQLTTGELVVNKDLTIDGAGAKIAIRLDAGTSRIFNVSGGNVTIANLTIRSGDSSTSTPAEGSGVYNTANLTLRNCTLTNNGRGSELGGAINNAGYARSDELHDLQ